MTAIAGRKADIYVTSGAAVSYADDPMSDVTANMPANPALLPRTVYQVTAAAKRYFDPSTPMVFQISLNSGGSWATAVPDAQAAGVITFLASQQAAPAAMFRAHTGKYLPYARMGGGYEWDGTVLMDVFDVSEFSQTAHHHIVGQAGGTIALKRWYYDDTMRAVLGNLLALSLYVDATAQPAAPRYECLAYLKADAIKAALKGALDEALTFEIESDVTFLSA